MRAVPNTYSTGEQNKCGDHPANTLTPACGRLVLPQRLQELKLGRLGAGARRNTMEREGTWGCEGAAWGIRTSGPHTKLSLKDKSLRSSTVGDKRSVVSRPARNPSVSEHYCGALEDSWRRGDVDEASILPASILKDNN